MAFFNYKPRKINKIFFTVVIRKIEIATTKDKYFISCELRDYKYESNLE